MEPDLVDGHADTTDGPWVRLKRLFYESRPLQIVSMMLADAVIVIMALFLAYFARFEGEVPRQFLQYIVPAMFVTIAVFIVAMWVARLYHIVLRYVGIQVMGRLTAAVAAALLVLGASDYILGEALGSRPVPLGVILIVGAFAFVGLAALRSVGRLWVVMTGAGRKGDHRVLIIGAGDAGSLLLRDIETQPQLGYNVIGYLDDQRAKQGLRVRSVEVLGTIADLPQVVERYAIDEILVAIPSMGADRRREILELCTSAGIPTRIISGLTGVAGSPGVADLRPVEIEDLLGREPNQIDLELISETLTGKVVAVTGAAGSIGSELCRQIAKLRPSKLVLIEVDESRLYELFLEMEDAWPTMSVMRMCDIREERKLTRVFREERPQVVFHAAAYKHVPLMELEPSEAVRTNILGTMNVVNACNEVDAERFVLISTDKAVEPRNVMGATKYMAEHVMLAAARYGIGAIAVRFGNVLGSRGSVVPIFEEQLRRGGPIKVTDPAVTRYFMTIPEAARLVLQAQAMSCGGDIFILDMGEPVKITDLAQRMIVLSGVPTHIEFTGLRPGEKMHETLVHADGALLDTDSPAVKQLNLLPRVASDFSDAVHDLLVHARHGDDTETRALLAELSGACFGETNDEGECFEPELEW
ncbi:MAG: nucleoside-diphosphate sugar epimerase/dehydratase [Coriobacteriia bacterium]